MKRTMLLITVLLVLLLSACAGGSSAVNLDGEWKLTALDGKAPLDGTQITITFKAGETSGNAGCNSYGGQYQVKDGKLTFSNLLSTLMACQDQGVMDQEQAYMQAIGQAAGFTLTDDRLQLTNANGNVILEFSK